MFQLFDERPVWTKAGLAFFAKNIENSAMKFILAASAYYFTTGPWRNAWVRFGYDPRQDVNARFFLFLFFFFVVVSFNFIKETAPCMIDNYYDVYKLARFVSIFGIVFHEDYSELKLVTEKRL